MCFFIAVDKNHNKRDDNERGQHNSECCKKRAPKTGIQPHGRRQPDGACYKELAVYAQLEVGRYFYRRYGISSVFMRLGNGFSADEARPLRARVEALLRLPEKERGLEVRRIEADMEERRQYAFAVAPPYRNGTEYVFDCFTKEQIIWSNYIHNCLTYLHIDDLADAAICAINARYEGSYPIYVTDYVNVLGIESAVLAKLLYPGATINHSLLKGFDALADYREAERIIGFRAKRTFDGRHSDIYA